MMRRNPQRREGLWNGAVELYLWMKIMFWGWEGECRGCPAVFLCMFDPL